MHEHLTDAGETEPRLQPRIYVASLADYNAGRLHGTWLDANQPPDELQRGIDAMLATSPEPVAEEYAVHDYDGFGGLPLGEHASLETISRIAHALAEHGQPFAAFASHVGIDDASEEAFTAQYRGLWESLADYAEHLLDDLGVKQKFDALPDWLQPYVTIDYEGFGRDLELGGDIFTIKELWYVYVFDARE